jgi:hypothetical protein
MKKIDCVIGLELEDLYCAQVWRYIDSSTIGSTIDYEISDQWLLSDKYDSVSELLRSVPAYIITRVLMPDGTQYDLHKDGSFEEASTYFNFV